MNILMQQALCNTDNIIFDTHWIRINAYRYRLQVYYSMDGVQSPRKMQGRAATLLWHPSPFSCVCIFHMANFSDYFHVLHGKLSV